MMSSNISTGYHYEHYRNSAVMAHRLSVYMPNIFLPLKNPQKLVMDINSHLAMFRDMLINVGQYKDNPELRERIRKYRHLIVEECKHATEVMTEIVKRATPEVDTSPLVLLFYLLQQFSRELLKCYRLIQIIAMDMSKLNENRTKPTNLGNVFGQLLLCKQITPDFEQEELCSIANDLRDIELLTAEIQDLIPPRELLDAVPRKSLSCVLRNEKLFSKGSGLLCCVSRPKYM